MGYNNAQSKPNKSVFVALVQQNEANEWVPNIVGVYETMSLAEAGVHDWLVDHGETPPTTWVGDGDIVVTRGWTAVCQITRHDVWPSCPKIEAAPIGAIHAWQPIETAPLDGTVILAYFPLESHHIKHQCRITPVWFNGGLPRNNWVFASRAVASYDVEPTHWMPLPEPPKSQ